MKKVKSLIEDRSWVKNEEDSTVLPETAKKVSVVVTATDVGLPAEFALVWSDEDMLEIAWGIT